MPPEQALGLTKKVDVQSDVWSLGATLFFVLSGQSVHIAQHMDAMMLASAQARARSLADAAPELPSRVVAVVDQALRYRKVERFPDIAAMRTAWQDAKPDWLPTLRPQAREADPSFLDPSLLISVPHGDEEKMPEPSLFDPRELLDSVLEARPPIPAKTPGRAVPRPHPGPIPNQHQKVKKP
jgi:serine/threonine-protein kinase